MNRKEIEVMKAVDAGDLNLVRELVKELDSLEFKTVEGWTPLIKAVHKADLSMAKLLVENGASVHATNMKGTTVFMYAKTPVFDSHDTEILDWLLGQEIDINAKNHQELTVLDYVKRKEDEFLENWMREKGARFSSELI